MMQMDGSDDSEYYTADEGSDYEIMEDSVLYGFYLHTSSDGTRWYLPICQSVVNELSFVQYASNLDVV